MIDLTGLNVTDLIKQCQERSKFLSTSIRERVIQLLIDMYQDGQPAIIHEFVYRTPQKQIELYNSGNSQVKWGFHCATGPNGEPQSLAADVVHAKHGWFADKKFARENTDEEFWIKLGHHAHRNDLNWGGYWGLKDQDKSKLSNEIFQKIWYNGQVFGWDPAHVETSFVTIKEAMAGKR